MQQDEADGLADATAELAPTGRVRVGIAVGPTRSAVWTARDAATGQPTGVTVTLGRALGAALGTPVAFIEYASSGGIIEAANAGEWDATFTPVDAERKRHVAFGPSYHLGESTYLVAPGSGVQDLAGVDRPGMRVFGVENTATLRSCRRSLAQVEPIGVATLDEALAAMAEGRADALALGRESLAPLLKRFAGSRILPGHFHAAGTAVAVPLRRPAALAFAAAFIERAKADGTVRRAFDESGMAHAAVAPAGFMS